MTYYCAERVDLTLDDGMGNAIEEKLVLGLRSKMQATTETTDELLYTNLSLNTIGLDIFSHQTNVINYFLLTLPTHDFKYLPGGLQCNA